MKAKNKLDGRIYAVKKIPLRPSDNNAKIFREVNALARLSHRFIVRYYTTWIEISEGSETPAISSAETRSSLSEDPDITPRTTSRSADVFQIDLNDLARSSNNDSFPGIYFGDNTEIQGLSDSDSDDGSQPDVPQALRSRLAARLPASSMYIQMVSPYAACQHMIEWVDVGIRGEPYSKRGFILFYLLVFGLIVAEDCVWARWRWSMETLPSAARRTHSHVVFRDRKLLLLSSLVYRFWFAMLSFIGKCSNSRKSCCEFTIFTTRDIKLSNIFIGRSAAIP